MFDACVNTLPYALLSSPKPCQLHLSDFPFRCIINSATASLSRPLYRSGMQWTRCNDERRFIFFILRVLRGRCSVFRGLPPRRLIAICLQILLMDTCVDYRLVARPVHIFWLCRISGVNLLISLLSKHLGKLCFIWRPHSMLCLINYRNDFTDAIDEATRVCRLWSVDPKL